LSTVNILCMISVICNVLVLDFYCKDSSIHRDMPIWVVNLIFNKFNFFTSMFSIFIKLEKFVFYLGRLFCMKKLATKEDHPQLINEYKKTVDLIEEINVHNQYIDNGLMKSLKEIEIKLTSIYDHIKEINLNEEKELKWKFATNVMDRLFLFISIFYFLATFSSVILSIQNFYKFE
jgi:hypothetical protein